MRKALTAVVVFVVLVGGAGAWLLMRRGHAAKAGPATVTVARGDISATASASGAVEPINQRALTFGASGTIKTLDVKAGDRVTSGEVLATLDADAARSAVSAAQAALSAAQDNLALAEQQAAAPTPTPTPTASGGPAGGVPGTGSSGTGGLGTGGGSTRTSTASSLLRAKQAVNNDELALARAQAALDGTSIAAPAPGRVLSVAGKVGDAVNAGGSGFIIMSEGGAIAVEADFSEADVAAVKVGQTATVTLANHPDQQYAAVVTQIDPAGTTSGSLVRFGVHLGFASVPPDVLLGQSANVVITTASAANVLYVPAAAVSRNATGQDVVTIRTPTGDQPQIVTTGLVADQGVEIRSGLAEGQTVVVAGAGR